MAEEPKLLSEKLEALRDEFNTLAERSKAAVARLNSAIWEAKSAELRADLDKVLDQFIPTVDKSALKGHDIVFLINKSEDMGEGFTSRIGAAIDVARSLNSAGNGHDVNVSAGLWETGSNTKWVNLSDSDRMEKAREKTKANGKDLLPVVRDIMINNTPDKQGERKKHYIVISTGAVNDSIDHSAQMINTAMQMNPRVTFDFVSFGTGEGNVKDLLAKLTPSSEAQMPGNYTVAKPEDLQATVMGLLTGRFGGKLDAPKPVQAPQAASEAPKPAETPKAEAPVVAEPPKPAPKVIDPPVAETPKADTPKAVAPIVAEAKATPEAAKPEGKIRRLFRFGR